MKSQWSNKELKKFGDDDLARRVYTSRLLGREPSLVLHGGGNTSVKTEVRTMLGDVEDILYVKGSGWDLATIEKPGFAPVRMETLLKMAQLNKLDDQKMVHLQRAAMIDPYAPNPSVEAILHAIIPYKFVDHTHADAVVTLTNIPTWKRKIQYIYGDDVIVVPYVMPGFILAREIYKLTRDIDWSKYKGMVLLNHGVFTFHNDARISYENMIELVTRAEKYLKKHVSVPSVKLKSASVDVLKLARIRRAVSEVRGKAMLAGLDQSKSQRQFSVRPDRQKISQQGPLTPDHIIRTKRVPVLIGENAERSVAKFTKEYQVYFKKHASLHHQCLDCAPRWGIWREMGTLAFGRSVKEMDIIHDIKRHTTQAIVNAEALGGWRALSSRDLFEMEYWVLEQAKLAKSGVELPFQGKVAIVTGAASGIGKACVTQLVTQGAAVVALDINPKIIKMFDSPNVLGVKVDMTKPAQIKKAVESAVIKFGGIDVLICNAGIFPESESIADMKTKTWDKSLDINLTAHQRLMQSCIPFLKLGIDPSIVIVASKNVPAPGPGVSAYSVPKAGLTQLGRVAALELADSGIRVNMLHPNAVFDTAIWTDEVLKKRARHYNMTVDEYKTNNLLHVEITSDDVAKLIATMAGPIFSKTTGAQVPIDGGNERVI